ncbi:MAG: hypothetical protein ACI86M_001270 [Saprospiraceae bacterium]|jgi:hypothetical protein
MCSGFVSKEEIDKTDLSLIGEISIDIPVFFVF